MSVLGRFPRWLRVLLLGIDLAAAAGVLAAFWSASYPNLIAAWFQFAAVAALAVPFGAWAQRRLDERQEHMARRAAEHTTAHLVQHHETTREHIAALSDQVAALHAKIDQQQGGSS